MTNPNISVVIFVQINLGISDFFLTFAIEKEIKQR